MIQLVALSLAIMMAGAPAWVAEAAEDECAEECAGDRSAGGCEEQGCGDCSVVCSYCPRPHLVVPQVADVPAVEMATLRDSAPPTCERVPTGPPPRGVFHPPRVG